MPRLRDSFSTCCSAAVTSFRGSRLWQLVSASVTPFAPCIARALQRASTASIASWNVHNKIVEVALLRRDLGDAESRFAGSNSKDAQNVCASYFSTSSLLPALTCGRSRNVQRKARNGGNSQKAPANHSSKKEATQVLL
ncbi:unnamed protein product [Effrenium voratum]|nr:unnamed protein product [Effrenium voratum]